MNQLRFVFGACLSSILLIACGGSQTLSTPGAMPLNPATTTQVHYGPVVEAAGSQEHAGGKLFVADYAASKILVYHAGVQNPAPIGTISRGIINPYGIAIDHQGTLYVQNGNNTITEYRKDQKTVSKTLSEVGAKLTCTSLAVGSDGTVYSEDYGEVFEFAGGSTTPTMTLSVPYAAGLALDSKNNLFVSWNHGVMYDNGVYKFKPGSDVEKSRLSGIYAGSLAVDSHDNLLVAAGDIFIFKPGSKTSFRQIRTGHFPTSQFALDSGGKRLYTVLNGTPPVYGYDYATGKLEWTVKKGLLPIVTGVALQPAPH